MESYGGDATKTMIGMNRQSEWFVHPWSVRAMVVLALLVWSFPAMAKAPPPGSGNADVPANLMMMVDTSGSMGWRISGGGWGHCRANEPNCKSRMSQSKKVIKAIVTDSDLTTGVNYGLMSWDSYAISPTRRNRDHPANIPVSKTGATQINQDLDRLCPPRSGRVNYCSGGTYLGKAMDTAAAYFNGPDTPIDPKSKGCQVNALLVITDGAYFGKDPLPMTRTLAKQGIKTWVIGFGLQGSWVKQKYTQLADAGDDGVMNGSGKPMFADNWKDLQAALSTAIRQIIASKLTFATPALMEDVAGDGFVLQSTFDYKKDTQWTGHLHKYELKKDGNIGPRLWDAAVQLNNTPFTSRTLHTVLPSCNNIFIEQGTWCGAPLLSALWGNSPPVTVSEQEALIYFIAGRDAYDENSDGSYTDDRHKLADIYHSSPTVIGPPTAPTAQSPTYTESYYRHVNGYEAFKNSSRCGATCKDRTEIVLAGSNGGMLHAFRQSDGQELWGFIPPSLLPELRTMVNSGPNGTVYNKTISIFGVDGTPVAKDIYVNGQWKTVMMVGLRGGGHSYFALDITNPKEPKHLFTFNNDPQEEEISYWDKNGVRTDYSYASGTAVTVTVSGANPNTQIAFATGNRIDNSGTTANGLVQSWNYSTGHLKLTGVSGTFGVGDVLVASDCSQTTSGPCPLTGTTGVVQSIKKVSQPPAEFDFRRLGEAWSTPLIVHTEKGWVAVIGGGFNASTNKKYGNMVYVLDLERGGRILKAILLPDAGPNNGIENAVPAPVMAVTADMTSIATYAGAMAYVVDLEGQVWKINLTNTGTWGAATRLFDTEASMNNGRLVFNQPALAIGSEFKLWLYFGTGNSEKLQDTFGSENRLYGIRDKDFPAFNSGQQPFTVKSPECNDATSGNIACPPYPGKGWYRDLDPNEKVTGRPLVYDRTVYFPYYLPLTTNPCKPGEGFLAALDYQCGKKREIIKLGPGIPTAPSIRDGKIYLGISSPGGAGPGGPGGGLPPGWKRTGNLIIGTTPPGFSGQLTFETWRELY